MLNCNCRPVIRRTELVTMLDCNSDREKNGRSENSSSRGHPASSENHSSYRTGGGGGGSSSENNGRGGGGLNSTEDMDISSSRDATPTSENEDSNNKIQLGVMPNSGLGGSALPAQMASHPDPHHSHHHHPHHHHASHNHQVGLCN